MLVFIEGRVTAKEGQGVILESNKLGYFLFATRQTQGALEVGRTVKLLVWQHIKDDGHHLYGFLEAEERRMFELLKSVNGVGPKMALSLLELGDLPDLQAAVAEKDKKYLASASGVGPRLVDRICLELKDKLPETTGFAGERPAATGDEALEALQSLGLSLQQAKQALAEVDRDLETETRIKEALQRVKLN